MDALLVVMALIWGVNYSVIKRAFDEIPAQPFNALRLLLASAVFLLAIWWVRRRARMPDARISPVFYTANHLTPRDRWDLAWLAFVGQFIYQFCFAAGVEVTSVSNAALIAAATPAVVAVWAALLGRQRIAGLHWIGAAVSAFGIYLVVGPHASFGGATVRGDLMIGISVLCWAAYTLGARRLIARHSPLYVTGMTMAIGGVPYALAMTPRILLVPWSGVSVWTGVALLLSTLLSLCLAYLIWYMAVQKIGAPHTAMYSNVVPIIAMAVAVVWLHEPLSAGKILGAAAVLGGVFLTRLGRPVPLVPIEE